MMPKTFWRVDAVNSEGLARSKVMASGLMAKKFRFDPTERQALWLGLQVGSENGGWEHLSDSEAQLFSPVLQEILHSRDSRGVAHQNSPRRTTLWFSKKERHLIREMLRAAYDSDDPQPPTHDWEAEPDPFTTSDRALVLHLLNVFEKAR